MGDGTKLSRIFEKKGVRIVLRLAVLFMVIGIYVFVLDRIFGGSCPIFMIFHVRCPFCGMTRAHLALLHGDIRGAFNYHPLFFLGIPFLILVFLDGDIPGKYHKAYSTAVIFLIVLFIAVWALRTFIIGFRWKE